MTRRKKAKPTPDPLAIYNDAAVQSVQAASILSGMYERALKGKELLGLPEEIEKAAGDLQPSEDELQSIIADGFERKFKNLNAALELAERLVPESTRAAVMRAGNGIHNLLGARGVSIHDAAVKLGNRLTLRLPDERDELAFVVAMKRFPLEEWYSHRSEGTPYADVLTGLEAERLAAVLPASPSASASDAASVSRPERSVAKTGRGGRRREWESLDKAIIEASPEEADEQIAAKWRKHNPSHSKRGKVNAAKIQERRAAIKRQCKSNHENESEK